VPGQFALRAALAAVCVAVAVASVLAYISSGRVKDATSRFVAGGGPARLLRDMRASESPFNPSNYRDQGIAIGLLHTGHPAAAERFLAREARAQPRNEFIWVPLARVQLARGRRAAALRSWEHARRIDPHLPARLFSPA
jgi:predicted Zn-dependent protease